MKLFVVIGGWDYEGYSEPCGIYSTKEKAEAAVARTRTRYDTIDILEYELDVDSNSAL